MMTKRNPGWKHEPLRHSLASKGIKTNVDMDSNKYGSKGIDELENLVENDELYGLSGFFMDYDSFIHTDYSFYPPESVLMVDYGMYDDEEAIWSIHKDLREKLVKYGFSVHTFIESGIAWTEIKYTRKPIKSGSLKRKLPYTSDKRFR